MKLKLLDVGGGFPPAHAGSAFEEIAKELGPSVDELFPPEIKVISEPGRYYVSSAFTLVVQVTSRRISYDPTTMKKTYMYYLNDGIYGSFNCMIFDQAQLNPIVISGESRFNGDEGEQATFKSSLWGPTCDSIDCLGKEYMLPELQVGDWLKFEFMGAYTLSSASTFNGFKKSRIMYVSP